MPPLVIFPEFKFIPLTLIDGLPLKFVAVPEILPVIFPETFPINEVALTVPTTSNSFVGIAVPIPILPPELLLYK